MGSSGSKKKHPQGPVRHASGSGVFIQLLEFPGIYGVRDDLLKGKKYTWTQHHKCSLGGYTFAVRCRFEIDKDGDVMMGVIVYLQTGEWDNNMEWPFDRTIWVDITHPRDHEKDIWFRVNLSGDNMTRRPRPCCWNTGRITHLVNFKRLEHNGFIHDDKLYVNIELH
ncbi:hypothetical protein HPB52_004600 [Rhipicephalus sanguineus]|uniref:TRAF1-6 MATH domain-containing protein n=1 Tax=Rhipicephalus sanguineus TaxID=34632 RepID=A0A9D4QDC9_RHISA|nr:hypothetical protein HPB52_004600 [Rhipicephalus sanguineus]